MVNPNGLSTNVHFQYGTTTSYGLSTASQSFSGNTTQPVSANIPGLSPNTTYHFRLVGTNSGGTSFGSDMTFTTNGPPIVTTGAATNVTSSSATLHGMVNPNGLSTNVHFEYGTTTSYGLSTASQSFSGNTTQPVSANIPGLSPNTTYHFRLVGTNSGGTSFGSDMTFTTNGPPIVTTGAATNVTSSSATLHGMVNPNGLSTNVHFEYGTTTSYGSNTAVQSFSGNTTQPVSANIPGLSPNTTYHFRLVGTNSGGTSFGSDMTFTTNGPPIVTTGAATNVTSSSATLHGMVNPNGLSTNVHFEYGTTTSYGSNTAVQSFSGNTTQPVSANIPGLSPNTTYHFRLVGTNSGGTSFGSDMTFTTNGPPIVTTGAATNVTSSSATLHGMVNPNGLSTNVHFEYGTTTSYGSNTAVQSFSGNTTQPVSANIPGLSPNTTYHFRLVGTNSGGTSFGSDMTFTTNGPPIVTTGAATNVTSSSATLHGMVNPNGLSTNVHFEYGTTTSYGSNTAVQSFSGNTTQPVSANIPGLSPNTTYHFRLVGTNSGGTSFGSDMTFTTNGPPIVTTGAATNVTSSSATLHGMVNPNGLSTNVHFEYGTTTSYGSNTAVQSFSGNTTQPVSANIPGLSPNTTYHFRLVGTNSGGTSFGSDMTFTTNGPPIVTTGAATNVTSSSATLHGMVNPNGLSTNVHFEYGTTTSYGSNTAVQSFSGNTTQPVSANIPGLSPNTTYHFRLVGTNSGGTSFGSDMTFTTNGPPIVTTGAATNVTSSSATLHGMVNPNGLSTNVHFEYGTTTNYGSNTAVQSFSGNTTQPVSANISGLSPNTTYHFRLVGTNSGGTSFGSDMTFTTNGPPIVTTGAATNVTSSSATLHGMVNPNGLS